MNPWEKLKLSTSARVGLGRTGSSLPTAKVLEFQRAHSAARNAVWLDWNSVALASELEKKGLSPLFLESKINNRQDYLCNPNNGRLLSDASKEKISSHTNDIAFVVSDGLSALAIQNHFLNFWEKFSPCLATSFPELTYRLFLVPFSRVALADEVGELTKAQLSVIFIGERPGLNSPDSMGVYMTFQPKRGNSDAQRNCISNIREPLGMNYHHAAIKLEYLMNQSLHLQISGVNLKDEMDLNLLR